MTMLVWFQSSPVPRDRCNLLLPASQAHGRTVSILTGPEGPVQDGRRSYGSVGRLVSILTGPEGPVQLHIDAGGYLRNQSFNPHRSRGTGATIPLCLIVAVVVVSILTGPEGPVQPRINIQNASQIVFQSSPVPRDRCN